MTHNGSAKLLLTKEIPWSWVVVTTLAAFLGAVAAVRLFPTAAFGANSGGKYGTNVFGFSICLALPFATAQWLALRRYVKLLEISAKPTWGWLPATAVGIVATILPLWNESATVIYHAPHVVLVPMLPGAALLGFMQWIALCFIFGHSLAGRWPLFTMFGVLTGSFLTLSYSFFIFFIFGSIDVVWYTAVAFTISVYQAPILRKIFKGYG